MPPTAPASAPDATLVRRLGAHLVVPGLASVHSHAFQRLLRGRTERVATGSHTFWSWRGLMYEMAERLDPETLFAVSRFAFAELLEHGFTAVGEFHYLHHGPGGEPYGDRTALSKAVIEAALDAGIRLTFLRVLYERGGAGRPLEGAQQRFGDRSRDEALADLETLAARYKGQDAVRFGLAPHSVRAVTADTLREAARWTDARRWPLHMHVSEQRRELEECVAEHGLTPLALAASLGLVGPRFVAVHATHLGAEERALLGAARAFACICRTTERNLGDGLPNVRALREAGARLCVGTDSHASSDPFEELRAIEHDERSRTETRLAAADATTLLEAGSTHGYAALGWDAATTTDRVLLRADDTTFAGLTDALLDDAVVFGASPRAVDEVWVNDRLVVTQGRHLRAAEFRAAYEDATRRLGLTER